jgi:hypothetical protein
MPKWLVLSLFLALLVSPSSADAQGETRLEAVNIELRSEYEQPSVLVLYGFSVARETPLPAEVTLRLPKDSNLISVTVNHSGTWYSKDYTLPGEQGNWQTITINTETYEPHRIEYYQPLIHNNDKRQFKFQWFGDYYVNEFTVHLLIPADSTDLITTPALEVTTITSDGSLLTGTVVKRDLKMMNSFQFSLEYQRTSTALVKPEIETAPVVPAVPVDENTPGRVSITNLPWIIGGFGLALICFALFSYWRSTQTGESQPRKSRPHKREVREAGQAYCQECGTRAYAGDRFCRTCGSRLRVG